MDKATVYKIRPLSWKIYVQGKNAATFVHGRNNRYWSTTLL
jgi:hypothetical protein